MLNASDKCSLKQWHVHVCCWPPTFHSSCSMLIIVRRCAWIFAPLDCEGCCSAFDHLSLVRFGVLRSSCFAEPFGSQCTQFNFGIQPWDLWNTKPRKSSNVFGISSISLIVSRDSSLVYISMYTVTTVYRPNIGQQLCLSRTFFWAT